MFAMRYRRQIVGEHVRVVWLPVCEACGYEFDAVVGDTPSDLRRRETSQMLLLMADHAEDHIREGKWSDL